MIFYLLTSKSFMQATTKKILIFFPALLLSGCYVTVQPGAQSEPTPPPQPTPMQIIQPMFPAFPAGNNAHIIPIPGKLVPVTPHQAILPGQTQHIAHMDINPTNACQDRKNPGCHKPMHLMFGGK
jgi:hypothetical protein